MGDENQKAEGSISRKFDLLIFSLSTFLVTYWIVSVVLTSEGILMALLGILVIMLVLGIPYIFAIRAYTGKTHAGRTLVYIRTKEGKSERVHVGTSAYGEQEVLFCLVVIIVIISMWWEGDLPMRLINVIPALIGIACLEFLFSSGRAERTHERVYELIE